ARKIAPPGGPCGRKHRTDPGLHPPHRDTPAPGSDYAATAFQNALLVVAREAQSVGRGWRNLPKPTVHKTGRQGSAGGLDRQSSYVSESKLKIKHDPGFTFTYAVIGTADP